MLLEDVRESDEEHEEEYNHDIPISHDQDDSSDDGDVEPPTHPVSAMQEAFEESIREAGHEEKEEDTLEDGHKSPDAEARRRELLDRDTFDDSWTTRWKQRSSARCHPLVKLMAQIIFGLHLLHHQQARSDAEVVKILQVHVDEIDGFLEKTTEDFDLAIKDIEERISFLRLPMTHVEVFDIMLEDRKFRTQLVEGNGKIESIIERTAKAMNAALLDIQKGVNTVQQLSQYLDKVSNDWPQKSPEQAAILVAMRGNEEGWKACFSDLQVKGNKLGVALVKLGTIVGEMNKLAAAASRRKTVKTAAAKQAAQRASVPKSKYSGEKTPSAPASEPTIQARNPHKVDHHTDVNNRQAIPDDMEKRREKWRKDYSDKPLPKDPDLIGAALKATIPRAHPVHLNSRQDSPIEEDDKPSPLIATVKRVSSPSTKPRPASHLEPRSPTSPLTSQTKELAGFIRNSAPTDKRHSYDPSASTSKSANRQSTGNDKPRRASTLSRSASGRISAALSSRPLANSVPRSFRGSSNLDSHLDPNRTTSTDNKTNNIASTQPKTPPRLGLFPTSHSPSPVPGGSRSSSFGGATPNYTTAKGRAATASPEGIKSPTFSIRRMFNRKQKDQPVVV